MASRCHDGDQVKNGWNDVAPGDRFGNKAGGQDAAPAAQWKEGTGSAALHSSWKPDLGVDLCKQPGPSGEVARGCRAVELDGMELRELDGMELRTNAATRGNQLQNAVTLAQAEQVLSKKAMKSRARRDRQRQVWALRDLLMSKAAALSDDSSESGHQTVDPRLLQWVGITCFVMVTTQLVGATAAVLNVVISLRKPK